MTVQSAGTAAPPFDCVLASTLFPAALRLAHLATHPHGAGAEPVATLEQLSEQVRGGGGRRELSPPPVRGVAC